MSCCNFENLKTRQSLTVDSADSDIMGRSVTTRQTADDFASVGYS